MAKEVEAAFEAEKDDFLNQLSGFGIHLKNVVCVVDVQSKSKRSWICPGKGLFRLQQLCCNL